MKGVQSLTWTWMLLIFMLAYILQRQGCLIHGPSYYLPQNTVGKKANTFRNIMFHTAQEYGIKGCDISKVIMPLPSNMSIAMTSTSMNEVHTIVNGVLPSALYELGETTPFVAIPLNLPNIESIANRPTMVFFPGILSEFVDVAVMDELFRNCSGNGLHELYLNELNNASLDPLKKTLTVDKVFSLDKLQRVQVDMKDLVQVAEHPSGEFNVMRILFPSGSLESVGTLEKSSRAALKRLDKVFTLMSEHLKGPIHLAGYSRGANVALDVLVRATKHSEMYSWFPRVNSFISLAGVLYGTPSADAINISGHPMNKVVNMMINCSIQMDYSHAGDLGSVDHALEIGANTKLLIDFFLGLANMGASPPKNPHLEMEFSRSPDIHFLNIASILRRMLMELIHLQAPVEDYYENVRRFKLLVNALLDGFQSITTQECLNWWKENTLPTTVKYYAIAGTMTDPTGLDRENIHEMERDINYDEKSLDYRTNRMFFYDLLRDGKTALNDGQMPVTSALFWPNVILNPEQRPLSVTNLGIVYSHHWSIALPRVFDKFENPFPRELLVHSIARFIARS